MPWPRRCQEKSYTTVPGEEYGNSVDRDTSSYFESPVLQTFSYRRCFTNSLLFGYLILFLWTGFLVYNTIHLLKLSYSTRNPLFLYNPIPDEVLQHERVVFNQGFYHERTNYMGGSKEANDSWMELVTHGIIKLDAATASKLHDPTASMHDKDGHYVAAIEMWHQLHCVNTIRKTLWSSTPTTLFGKDPSSWEVEHIDHCIDVLRQTLMCHGDIGIIPYSYLNKTYLPLFNATRVCKNYEVLRDWVDENQAGNHTPEGLFGVHSHREHLLGVD